MKTDRRGKSNGTARKWLLTGLLAAVMAAIALVPAAALAEKEAVFLNENVYFTLENVRFTEGISDSTLRFTVRLHNGGNTVVDYNRYGVRVTDADGFSYTAQLNGKQTARVFPGKDQPFSYVSRIAKGIRADQLNVTVFSWNYGGDRLMDDIGTLSVAAALAADADAPPEAMVPLFPVSGDLPGDAAVTFRLVNEYDVYQSGNWVWIGEAVAENKGSSALTLPDGLKFRLAHSSGRTLDVSIAEGADQPLLPGKPRKVVFHAAMPEIDTDGRWMLQFYYVNAGNVETELDALILGESGSPARIGESRPITDSNGREALTATVERALVSQSEDGQSVQTTVRVANPGSRVVALPTIVAAYQSVSDGVSIEANDPVVHPAYLSPGKTESYTFSAVLPAGVEADQVQLVLFRSDSDASAGGNGVSSPGNSATEKTLPVLVADLDGAQLYTPGTFGEAVEYRVGDPIRLSLKQKMDVSVMEFKLYENEDNGYETAVAKLKLTNRDDIALPIPDLLLDLVDEDGRVYSGARQANVAQQLAANSSYIVTYSFLMPSAPADRPVMLRFYEGKEAADAKMPSGAVKVAFERDDAKDDIWNVYPYRIEVREDDLLVGVLSTTFSYTMKLNVNIERKDQVIVDPDVSKLQFELTDGAGQVIAVQTLPLLGTTKLVNGENSLLFSNLKINQFSSTNYVNVFEIVTTPNGVVKRKLGEID